jgi:hypothetical protein
VHNLEKEPGPAIADAARGSPEARRHRRARRCSAEKFGGPVDIVAFASTHREVAILKDGVLFVNPGSPTFPKGRAARVAGQRALGTVGVLDVSGGTAVFEVIHLGEIAAATQDGHARRSAPDRRCERHPRRRRGRSRARRRRPSAAR